MAVGMESREEAEGELDQPGEGAGGQRRHLPTSILPRPNWRREYMSKAAQVTPGPQEQHTHLVPALAREGMRCIHSDSWGGATEAAEGVAVGQWGCRAWSGLRCPLLPWQCGCVGTCIKNVGPVLQLWKGAHLPHASGLPRSFIWGFLPWAQCHVLRKPLLFLLLPVLLSPALLALLPAPPSARTAVHEGKGLSEIKPGCRDLSQAPPLACGKKREWRAFSWSPKLPYINPRV